MAAALAAAAFMVAALAAADFTEAVLVAAVSVAAAWPRLAASTAVNSAVFAAADFMIAASGTATSRSVRGFYAYDYHDPYTYDDSYYDDSYYDDDDGSCYVVQRRVHGPAGNATGTKPNDFNVAYAGGDNRYIAKSAAPAAALRETVSPYSGPTDSSGGNATDLYFEDSRTICCALEQ